MQMLEITAGQWSLKQSSDQRRITLKLNSRLWQIILFIHGEFAFSSFVHIENGESVILLRIN